jgi:hypothetical protein
MSTTVTGEADTVFAALRRESATSAHSPVTRTAVTSWRPPGPGTTAAVRCSA